jgi:hypothetical protein
MALRKKGTRRITVNNKDYLWYVGKDPMDRKFAKALHVVSPNKNFLAIYRLDFATEGSIFPKLEVIVSNNNKRGFYNINDNIHEQIIIPKPVREIILYCSLEGKEECIYKKENES